MDPVEEFVGRYLREYDFYAEAARLAANLLKSDLDAAGVRAIVTHRAKDVRRLEAKCRQREAKKEYRSVDDLYDDIADLAGVRIALYFPGERDQVDQAVTNLFELLAPPKTFPEDGKTRTGKKFAGYSAAHYRIRLKEETLAESVKRYAAARIEIQVASVLMHAWAEVEHDLAYKPLEGALSDEEEAILDELNGLVLTGEIALERLQKAGKARSSISGRRFANHYDLAAYLIDHASKTLDGPVSDSGLGRVDHLFELIRRLKIDTPEKISPYLQALHGNVELRPLAEQVVDELLTEEPSRYEIYRTVQDKYSSRKRTSGSSRSTLELGHFITTWILFETLVQELLPADGARNRIVIPTTRQLASLNILGPDALREIDLLRQLRNRLVHGQQTPPPDVIASATESLSRIVDQLERHKRSKGRRGSKPPHSDRDK
ncbi:RelA/SpoT domain-containing protein [Actinoplanes sp. NPDC023714]|uniref:GTP pyrophosphokinase n=1 Tax=Actinoplanes sp. NPDC023714 TaxID=3154322 RepID=UPI0033D0A99C